MRANKFCPSAVVQALIDLIRHEQQQLDRTGGTLIVVKITAMAKLNLVFGDVASDY